MADRGQHTSDGSRRGSRTTLVCVKIGVELGNECGGRMNMEIELKRCGGAIVE